MSAQSLVHLRRRPTSLSSRRDREKWGKVHSNILLPALDADNILCTNFATRSFPHGDGGPRRLYGVHAPGGDPAQRHRLRVRLSTIPIMARAGFWINLISIVLITLLGTFLIQVFLV